MKSAKKRNKWQAKRKSKKCGISAPRRALATRVKATSSQ
jgi:hypothetical protein